MATVTSQSPFSLPDPRLPCPAWHPRSGQRVPHPVAGSRRHRTRPTPGTQQRRRLRAVAALDLFFEIGVDARRKRDQRRHRWRLSVRSLTLAASVTDADQVDQAIERVGAEVGPLKMAVNSAGIANAAPAEEMSLEQRQRVIGINVNGVFLSSPVRPRAGRCSRTAMAPLGDRPFRA